MNNQSTIDEIFPPSQDFYTKQIDIILKHVPKKWAEILAPDMNLCPGTLRSFAAGRRGYPEQQEKLLELLTKMLRTRRDQANQKSKELLELLK